MYYRTTSRTPPLAVKLVVLLVTAVFFAILSLPLWGPAVLTRIYLNNWDSRLASQVVVVKTKIHNSWPLFAQTAAAKPGE